MDQLKTKAKQILLKNWKDGFTIPTSKLYPFQWNWDSGFVCLGQSHFQPEFAIQELHSLFTGQWENGMIPHILFHSEKETTYFPNYDFWNAAVNPGAPNNPKTSGITQPPVIGFILEELLKNYPDNENMIDFAKSIFGKIVKYHRFFYDYRDPLKEGLLFIYHPWESGRDNSPLWDDALSKIEIDYQTLPKYTRKDTSISDPSERPTSDKYDRYVYLLELGKKHQYDGIGIFEESPFLVQDTMMNAILIKSNQSLINIGKRFGFDVKEIEEWHQQSQVSFKEKFWNKNLKFYNGYDLRNQKSLEHKEIGGLTALFAEIPTENIALQLESYLTQLHDRNYYLCPSFDVDSPLFDSKRYWRGPIWPQMNWMIYKGLTAYGLQQTADIVRSDLIELVQKLGFYEYFEAHKPSAKLLSHGYGGNHFSWTAASILDLNHSK